MLVSEPLHVYYATPLELQFFQDYCLLLVCFMV